MQQTYSNISGYKFIPLEHLEDLKKQFIQQSEALNLKGTILLGDEGINLYVAGEPNAIDNFVKQLKSDPRFSDMYFKYSDSQFNPFQRLVVKIRDEIVTMGQSDIHPTEGTAPSIAPQKLKQWLDEEKDFTLLDVRNDYEYHLGAFEKAVDLNIPVFRDFPEAVNELDEEKSKPLVMYCTGGIRCEKAALLLQKRGFKDVYQLEGGILNYFAQVGGDHYRGECFVFDDRITVDTDLKETETRLCKYCQTPLTQRDHHQLQCTKCQSTSDLMEQRL